MAEFLTAEEKSKMLKNWVTNIKSRNDDTLISRLCQKFRQ